MRRPSLGRGKGAVDQRGIEAAQVAQGIAEVKRAFQAQQRQAVARGRPRSSTRVCCPLFCTTCARWLASSAPSVPHWVPYSTVRPPRWLVWRHGGQAFAQAPDQPGHFTGARAIGDKVPGAGPHGVEYQLIVHAVAQGHDGQHRLGLQRAFDQSALVADVFPVQADEHQVGEGHVYQCQQFVEAAAAGTDHLAQRRERALQPLQVGAVAGDCKEGLAQAFAHWDSPVRRSKLPFSRKNRRYQFGS